MSTVIRRAVRYALPARSGVARPGDRVEGAVLAVAVVVALLGVPVAAAVGSEVYASGKVTAAEQARTRHPVEARLLADAPPPPTAETGRGIAAEQPVALASWPAPDGTPRRGEVLTGAGARAGTVVRVWVDDTGAVRPAPLTVEGARVGGAVAAFALWCGLAGLLAFGWLVVHVVRGWLSAGSWEREWALVEPLWTGRRR
ncbi:hypothetical protein AB0A74_42325 [Saccharothrix sp. NPDC042600]|uniref:Rv1733c family protein n=1 Tax=Saccharothrix TaxID=2071 RepID=UPI0033D0061A|nr:membrane protein [Saccharothrix mutabilis subsp. capreolus]